MSLGAGVSLKSVLDKKGAINKYSPYKVVDQYLVDFGHILGTVVP